MVAPTSLLVDRSLWFADMLLCVILVVRLFRLKLAATYRFFFAFLIVSTVRSVAMWPLDMQSQNYITVWKWTQPVFWVLYTLIVMELSSLIFKEYQGIQVLGRRAVYGSLAVSILVSLLILAPVWRHSAEPTLSSARFFMVERGIDSALVLLLLLLLVFLALLPIPLCKNVVIHSVLYSTYFMTAAVGTFIADKISFETYTIVSTCLLGVYFINLVLWISLLTQEGESKIAVMPKPLPASYEEKLVEQLASINKTLLRASSKVDRERLVSR